eukprot:jgi/Bigna1/130955/aug1.12_g5663
MEKPVSYSDLTMNELNDDLEPKRKSICSTTECPALHKTFAVHEDELPQDPEVETTKSNKILQQVKLESLRNRVKHLMADLNLKENEITIRDTRILSLTKLAEQQESTLQKAYKEIERLDTQLITERSEGKVRLENSMLKRKSLSTQAKSMQFFLKSELQSLNPKEFEYFVASLYEACGYSARVNGGKNDEGVDIFVHHPDRGTGVIQCKAYSVGNRVVPKDLHALNGSRDKFQANFAVLVTTSVCTKAGRKFVAELNENTRHFEKEEEAAASSPSKGRTTPTMVVSIFIFVLKVETMLDLNAS